VIRPPELPPDAASRPEAPRPREAAPRSRGFGPRRLVALLLAAGVALLLVLVVRVVLEVSAADVSSLDRHAPAGTALMRQRVREAEQDHRAYAIDQRWVGYDDISPLLRRSVLVAEDDAFFSHDGLDWNEMRAAARKNLEAGKVVRGGSTITQQLAKNLFLGSERSLERKLKEVFLALKLEKALSKRRIFELYLNEIEWGDGIFGAEAAAQRYFGVPAADLNARQAALLAAVIINPRRYSPLQPSARIERRVRIIAGRLHARGALDDDQYQLALGNEPVHQPNWLERLFGAGAPDTASARREPDSSGAGEAPGIAPADSLSPPGREP
jgi:monofunctional biosynthetic peptidoglycan transglycosylase